LNFALVASSSAAVGAAPRRLRLESQGNNHRVYFNGVLVINHTATGTVYATGQPGIAASVFGGPEVRILSFEAGHLSATSDVTPPFRFNGQPAGTLASGTSQAALQLSTDENATCRYSTSAGVAYGSMTGTFSTTGGTTHTTVVTGLANGGSYQYRVRCIDGAANANTDDFSIAFSVAGASASTSNFSGAENPLSEGGVWDSPGSWLDLQKNSGAFTAAMNAAARRVTPSITPDQYAEITFDQDPGAGSWVGVTTRVQSGGNGSGYLAIAYAGQVRLYRADDAGALSFTLLASANVSLSTAPRRLRLESEGNTHRVYFNGSQVIGHTAVAPLYLSGQPGIAASTFGGPQVKILSFEAGPID
jgi:hypothetical protein